ncbi:MAG TPA: histidine phosphatase family protein, partial [Rhizomicrobium sp.]|nr:histidine phosphatase family protein [Rhizomicrobium sp.]
MMRAIAACLLFLLTCCPGVAQTLSGAALVQHLQEGGYVLLMRHASAPEARPDRQSAAPGNTAQERQLDDKGRAAAAAMGKAIKALHIPIGLVLSSPTYRALQTVRLAALGSPKIVAELGDNGHSMQQGAVARYAEWLRRTVATRPAEGTNTVIVTQMPNIVAAFAGESAGLT